MAGILLPVHGPALDAQGGDVTPPSLTVRSPGINATGVSAFINVTATFSEPIQPATVVMVLRNSGSVVQPAQLAYDAGTRTATLDPDSALAPSQTFTVTVSGARDLAGNQMAQVSWSFTTATPGFQDVLLPQVGLDSPTVIQFASDGRIFVAEKSGRIYFYDSITDASPTLFADLRTNVHNFWDRGMLGMALHPNFPATPYVYVLYTFDAVLPGFAAPRWGTAGATDDDCSAGATTNGCVVTGRLSRLNMNDFSGTPLTSANEQVLVQDWWQQFPSHSIGTIAFGADGALYATAGDGASFNYVDYGPPSSPAGSPPADDPPGEGGALRSQDLRTSPDPVTLGGAVIRIDPETGAALPDNPLFSDPNANARRIIAYGLRNPYRFTVKPGTNEVWIADVGWGDWEEINRIPNPTDSVVENFGWPCYEGDDPHNAYGAAAEICQDLYDELPNQSGLTAPHYTYHHADRVVSGEACPTGSSSISGLAFYPQAGGEYPSAYNGALFFADFSRDCIWAMRAGAGGQPNPADIVTIKSNPGGSREGPVHLISGPGGDIYYAGINDNRLHRIGYNSGNQPPTAVIQASPSSGASPLTVNFSAGSSGDPEGQPLSYAWDLDGDGAFDDSTAVAPQFTYSSGTPLTVTVRLRVSDSQGLSDVASTEVSINNTAPTPFITSPTGSLTWKVGDAISFSGGANDAEQGSLPASALLWSLVMHHCPSNCHQHNITDFVGVASGSFLAPDHEYPSHLELRLTATDSGGLQSTTSVNLNPQTVALTFQSNPSGVQLAVNGASAATPFTRTVIVGSANSVSAPSPTTLGALSYQFSSWSDGGAATHTITAPAAPATYTATYAPLAAPPGLVAAYAMDEASGATILDWSGSNLTGTITGATRITQGRFGGALSFDGVNDWVTVADATPLDLTTGMTLEAWVYPTANGGGSWRNLIIKERAGGEVYNLYANADTDAPVLYAIRAALPDVPLDARGTSQLTLNTWNHVAATYDNATLRLYVNGAQVGTRAMTGALLTSTGALRIGGNSVWGEFFQGRIDEVRIYNRALTQPEIQADRDTPIGVDTIPPVRSNGQPAGTLAAGTTQATLSLTTNENATCRYGSTAGVDYASLTTLAATGGTSHTTILTGLVNGGNYTRYVRCLDGAGNANTDDFVIAFNVANPPPPDTTPPVVAISAPANGATVFGNVTVSAAASDNVGVAGVQFFLDGLPLGAEDLTAPYSTVWNTTAVSNGGPYNLSARARDAATNQTISDTVSVTVNNASLGLVAAYSFNEGTGSTLTDRTGQGHTGTITGAAWTTQGRFGSALAFDGVNDRVTVNDAPALDLTTGMTLEAWVYPTALGAGSWRNVLIKERPGGEVYNLYANADTNAPTMFVVRAAQPDAPLDARGSNQLPLNTWTHLAATFNGTTLRVFVNGIEVGNRPVAGALLTSNGALQIGGNTVWGEYFEGRIDEVRIYNRALSAAEIQADLNSPVQP
jgi:glucose/arabinose dehydrogenase